MVAHEASKRKTLTDSFSGKYVFLGLIFCLAATTILVVLSIISGLNAPKPCGEPEEEPTPVLPEPEPEPEYQAIDFQPVVDQFVNSTTGNRSVLIYDLERDEIVGQYNPTEDYGTASLYKLFVVYEGYRRIQNGTWDPNAKVGYTGNTILECLDRAIRESYSPCAESLWAMIGHVELDNIIKTDFGIMNSDISHLVSNANDILAIMKLFYNHEALTNETYIARMKDSFLNQPITTYNWRQGLPSGFTRANVYNKVGWEYNPNGKYWNIYHDTAVVEFPEDNRHFIVVVMTNRVPFQSIRDFGSSLETFYYQ